MTSDNTTAPLVEAVETTLEAVDTVTETAVESAATSAEAARDALAAAEDAERAAETVVAIADATVVTAMAEAASTIAGYENRLALLEGQIAQCLIQTAEIKGLIQGMTSSLSTQEAEHSEAADTPMPIPTAEMDGADVAVPPEVPRPIVRKSRLL